MVSLTSVFGRFRFNVVCFAYFVGLFFLLVCRKKFIIVLLSFNHAVVTIKLSFFHLEKYVLWHYFTCTWFLCMQVMRSLIFSKGIPALYSSRYRIHHHTSSSLVEVIFFPNIFGVSSFLHALPQIPNTLRVCLDWGFRRGRAHFYFLNYEQCKMFFLKKIN